MMRLMFVWMLLWLYPSLAAAAPCIVGLSTVPCDKIPLTVVDVAPGELQAKLSVVVPGTTLRLRGGVHAGPLNVTRHGTAAAPIVITAYPGEAPVVQFTGIGEAQSFWLRGRYYVVEHLMIRGGYHCIAADAQYTVLRGNLIEDCGKTGGQGVLILNSDVALVDNVIRDIGTTWMSHGVYVSDFYGRNIKRISLIRNTLTDSAGGGFQVWNQIRRVTDVLLSNNGFARNALDVILTNVDRVDVNQNTVVHAGDHPSTNAPVQAAFWLELSTALRFTANSITATATTPACAPLYGPNQSLAQMTWSSNRFVHPAGCSAYGDAELNTAGGH